MVQQNKRSKKRSPIRVNRKQDRSLKKGKKKKHNGGRTLKKNKKNKKNKKKRIQKGGAPPIPVNAELVESMLFPLDPTFSGEVLSSARIAEPRMIAEYEWSVPVQGGVLMAVSYTHLTLPTKRMV